MWFCLTSGTANPPSTMRVLVIFAHPEPKSFVGALKDKTLEVMKELGHEVMLSDLYAM
jgi:NAD(P)H dehydrogenase (quinone)